MFKNLLRGNEEFDSLIGVEVCSTAFWMIFIAYTIILAAIFVLIYIITKDEEHQIHHIGYHVDYSWNLKYFIIVILVSIAAGLNTAIVGVGLGFIYTPAMRFFGFPHDIGEHTPIFIELIARGLITLQFFLNGDVEWDFFLWFSGWVLAGALVGLLLVDRLITNRFRFGLMLTGVMFMLGIA